MRKVLLLTILLVSAFIAQSQVVQESDRAASMQLINANKAKLGLSTDEISNLIVHTAYQIPNSDIRMAYIQQSYKGIPVYNQVLVLAFKNGSVVSNAGEILRYMESRTANHSGIPSVSLSTALQTAFSDRRVKFTGAIPVPEKKQNADKFDFGKMGVAKENVTAELLWLPSENNKEVKLVWQFFVAPAASSDYWLVRVDAVTNQVVSTTNLTVYCNWEKGGHSIEQHLNENHFSPAGNRNYVLQRDQVTNKWQYKPYIVNNATYRVIKYPAESPIHPGGAPQTHTNPWTWAPGNATTLGWHTSDNSNFYDSTRGNNVFAYEDRDANNIVGLAALSTTGQPDLTFDFVPDFTQAPTLRTPPNQQFNTTNLFYWNNLIHDISYVYGFTETARNFQTNNLGRGGAGNDHVLAEAQDGSGTNNANFSTPADGGSGRMQMFLWTTTTPQRDGDVDNGIILHEYTHGISNRLTGTGSGCLSNAEQMGEGWSDYYGLMLTQDWATSLPGDGFSKPRGIGTYALGQPITGVGIRPTRYGTNFADNPTTYATVPGLAIPHGVGYAWCTMLWDMTWEIIQTQGINSNLFNPAGGGGNAIALKLVQEGMRLQPCSPGFVDGRNAILKADTLFFGAQYSCAIIRAFARRGLGVNASQGSSTSTTDGVPDFSVDGTAITLTANVPSQVETGNIIYTTSVTAGNCTPVVNYTITDTLPTNVTYVSGGSYNAGNRVVSFNPVNIPVSTTQNFVFTVQVNAGSWFPPVNVLSENVDGVTAPALPAGWATASTTAGNNWVSSTAQRRSLPNSFFTPDPAITSDQTLTSPVFSIPAAPPPLVFWHFYNTEPSWDGGVVEISLNGGTTWADIGAANFISGGYNLTLNASANPISGRPAFSGSSGGFVQSRINLTPYASQANVRIRFRLGADASVGATGWFVDDISCNLLPVVNMRSSLFDASNIRIKFADAVTDILAGACTAPVVNAPTVTQPTCGGTLTGTIVVNATGTGTLEYSINGGTSWQLSNTFTGLVAGNYNIIVRLQSTPSCTTPYSGNPVVINPLTGTPTVNPPTVTQPACPILTGTIVVNATGTGTLEYSVNGGTSWQLSNTFPALPAGNYNIVVRLQSTPGCLTVYSGNPVTINTVNPPLVVTQPVNRIICQNGNTTFSITDNIPVPAPTYQWQISINGGSTWTNLTNVSPFSGVTTTTLTVTAAGLVYNGNLFRCAVQNICGTTNSNSASLTINPLPVVNSGPSGFCAPQTLTASGNSNTYSWSPATGLNTTTGATVIANPTVTTVYTVTGTLTATGCQNSASLIVFGTPVTPVITPAAPVICAGVIQPLTVAPTTFTVSYSGAAITIPATAGTATPYPAVINVAGLPTSGVRVKSITLNGVSHTFPVDIDALVQSPTGTNTVIMSDVGGTSAITGSNYTFDDAAAATMTTGTNPSGTYKPTNSGATDTWVAPGPGAITQATPLLSSFTGNLNGNWNLFVVDDANVDAGTINSWSIVFEVPTAVWTPASGLYTNAAATIPYTAGTTASTVYFSQSPAATTNYTYSVTNVLGSCSSASAGSVTVTVNPAPTIAVSPNNQCGPVVLAATGNANTYAWTPAAGLSTTTGASVTASPTLNTVYTVTGTLTATGCTATATATVNATPAAPLVTPSSVNMCAGSTTQFTVQATAITTLNGGAITIPLSGNASPYPATVSVGGLPTSGVRIKSVNINGISHTWPSDIDMLLQSPTGQNVVIMSDAGGGNPIANVNLVFDDAAAAILPGTIVSGTYRPTNTAGPDNFPSPGPGSITNVNPTLSTFTGNLNGTWNLYIVDQAGPDAGTINSWSITFEITGALWSPVTGLFTDPLATVPYVANTMASVVYAKPATTTSYSVTRATATCTSAATTVPVNVYQPLTITTQPANQNVCQGATATFSIVLGGNFPSYQWQISTDGGTTWNNISGANNSSLVLAGATTALSGNRYRVQATNSCSSVTSTVATLTVNPLPTVTATALPSRICISDTLIALSGSPTGGSWSGIGVSGFNFIPPATAVGTYTLTYTYTSPAGCVASSTVVAKVEDCPERIRLLRDNAVILWPNPNNGRFNIRINSVLYNYLNMKVYTSTGQLVRTQNFGGLVYGRVIPIDITNLPTDVYIVRFYYDDGVRTSEKAFKVVVGGH